MCSPLNCSLWLLGVISKYLKCVAWTNGSMINAWYVCNKRLACNVLKTWTDQSDPVGSELGPVRSVRVPLARAKTKWSGESRRELAGPAELNRTEPNRTKADLLKIIFLTIFTINLSCSCGIWTVQTRTKAFSLHMLIMRPLHWVWLVKTKNYISLNIVSKYVKLVSTV